jgi:hypothetical protein
MHVYLSQGKEFFFRSQELFAQSGNSPHFIEREISLQHPQELTTGTHYEKNLVHTFTPYHSFIWYILQSDLVRTVRPAHFILHCFDHCINIFRGVQIMSCSLCNFLHPRVTPTYFPHYSVLWHAVCPLPSVGEQKLIPTYIFVLNITKNQRKACKIIYIGTEQLNYT